MFSTRRKNCFSLARRTYVIEQSHRFTSDVVEMLFSGFCPVSGSPVFPGPNKRYAVALRDKDGRKYSGLAYLCCMPCSCCRGIA